MRSRPCSPAPITASSRPSASVSAMASRACANTAAPVPVGSSPRRERTNSGTMKISSISRSALVTAGWVRSISAATRETERWRSSASSSARCFRRRREMRLC